MATTNLIIYSLYQFNMGGVVEGCVAVLVDFEVRVVSRVHTIVGSEHFLTNARCQTRLEHPVG